MYTECAVHNSSVGQTDLVDRRHPRARQTSSSRYRWRTRPALSNSTPSPPHLRPRQSNDLSGQCGCTCSSRVCVRDHGVALQHKSKMLRSTVWPEATPRRHTCASVILHVRRCIISCQLRPCMLHAFLNCSLCVATGQSTVHHFFVEDEGQSVSMRYGEPVWAGSFLFLAFLSDDECWWVKP